MYPIIERHLLGIPTNQLDLWPQDAARARSERALLDKQLEREVARALKAMPSKSKKHVKKENS